MDYSDGAPQGAFGKPNTLLRVMYPISHERLITRNAEVMADLTLLPLDIWRGWCAAFHEEFRRNK